MKKLAIRGRAVTLTELLVVLAILSLLATLAVPVFVQKTDQARRSIARAEVRAIADAQQQVAVAHGFYVPIHFLNNLPNGPTTGPGSTGNRDDFNSYPAGFRGNISFIDVFQNVQAQSLAGAQPTLSDALSGANTRAASMVNFWSGPFLNPARVARDPTLAPDNQENLSYDIVLDPWGFPYRFYSPLGLVTNGTAQGTDATGFNPRADNRILWDNGNLTQIDGDRFDRFAIVSYGPNGISDTVTSGNQVADDIFYTFGFSPNETAFLAF